MSRPRQGRRVPFPPLEPPGLNHVVVTGMVSAQPQPARGPTGEPVTLLRVEFPVAHPDHPQVLWAWASCMVEVPASTEIEQLHGGAPVVAAGQLSDRWVIENGHTSRRGVHRRDAPQGGSVGTPLAIVGCIPLNNFY
jgi:hypothetical protein